MRAVLPDDIIHILQYRPIQNQVILECDTASHSFAINKEPEAQVLDTILSYEQLIAACQ